MLVSKCTSWLELKKHVPIKNKIYPFTLTAAGLTLDYSKQNVTPQTIALLLKLATARKLVAKRNAMFQGALINTTEQRPVLHTALRNPHQIPLLVNNEPIMPQIHQVLAEMAQCVKNIRNGKITDVVHIGIGGSHLGPAMVVKALQPFTSSNINIHFVANIDGSEIAATLKKLVPQTTLFIVASKTFTTQETIYNAETAKAWLLGTTKDLAKHFIAVTAKPHIARQFGITNIFPFWDWVGGRFSLWSAIGLSIAISIGMDNFNELLAGAYAMDTHFQEAPLAQNMPVILALLSIWNINFQQTNTQAIIPYDYYLELFPAYLQQLEMESNGKRVTHAGVPVDYKTAPIIWGGIGTNSQHAFHQLLMQGTHKVPVDFIIPRQSHNPIRKHHSLLYTNCLAQSLALMLGTTQEAAIQEMLVHNVPLEVAQKLAPHQVIPGQVPSNTILMDQLTPKTLGALLALYEHKVFVQGVIWDINSFDQWGVELGKKLATSLLPSSN